MSAVMKPLTGKLIVNSQPGEAEIWINGQLRGRTPTTVHDVDMGTARRLELRLKGYQPFVADERADLARREAATLTPRGSRARRCCRPRPHLRI